MKHLILIVSFLFSLNATAQSCYESSIVNPSPFLGNNDEIFKLSDGTTWQVKYEYSYLYEYSPAVIICPDKRKLIIKDKSLTVELLSSARPNSSNQVRTGEWNLFEETNLQGSISGTIQQGHIFKTISGSIYEVTGLTMQLVLELQPEVMVLKNGDSYKLIVKGFDEPMICRKLN